MKNEELFNGSEAIVADIAEKILIASCASNIPENNVERIKGSFYLAEMFVEEIHRRRRTI